MKEVISILAKVGPSRSSKIADLLQKNLGITAEAARKKISRANEGVFKFPVPLLPNRENFVYLKEHRKEERFWLYFLEALRETNSIYGMAIDGLVARGGIVPVGEFAVVSGAPTSMRRQISSNRLAEDLIAAGVIERQEVSGLDCFVIRRSELCLPDYIGFKPRLLTEGIVLDAVREWAKKMGFASYHSIFIRSDEAERIVGPFKWDLTGPSYLLPLKGEKSKPGFFVADVFSGVTIEPAHVAYISRKSQLLVASMRNTRILPMLIADSFTGAALTKGRGDGIVLATPETLFGYGVARGLKNLLETLKNASAVASRNPAKLIQLVEELTTIEGAAGNLRGILFELVSAYIAKVLGGSIDIGLTARHSETGKTADIDILRVVNKGKCIAIECKGKNPGGTVSLEEVQDWLKRVPIFLSYVKGQPRFAESEINFELWTSGNFTADALALLEKEKAARTKHSISWMNGDEIFNVSKTAKEKRITETLKEHFLRHPLAKK